MTHRCVETRSTLLDISEMKSRYIGDRLNVIVAGKVGIGFAVVIGISSGNGGYSVESDRLRKDGAEVRIGCAACASLAASIGSVSVVVRDRLRDRKTVHAMILLTCPLLSFT